MQARGIALAAAGVVVLVVLFVVLRPGGDDGPDPTAQPTTTEESPTTTQSETATETETATTDTVPQPDGKPKPLRIRVVYRNGEVVGGIREATVKQGRRVVLVVRSDVADHVHVHGYDLFQDVEPGVPARIAFRADVPGRFDVELEDRHLPLAEIEVRP